jgi:hypothetical protein
MPMLDLLFRSQYKRECDMDDALNHIARHGAAALTIARDRAGDSRLTKRNRRHWRRISRLVARREQEQQAGMVLARNG